MSLSIVLRYGKLVWQDVGHTDPGGTFVRRDAAWALTVVGALVALTACTPAPPGNTDTTASPPGSAGATVAEYGGNWTTLTIPDGGPGRKVPFQFHGVIGVPAGAGKHPVVVITHGSHEYCMAPTMGDEETWPCPADKYVRNDIGFTHLVRALAERGYLALSVDNNVALLGYFMGPHGGRLVIDYHLRALAQAVAGKANRFGAPLRGRADLTRLAVLGHSMGGEWVYEVQKARKGKGDQADGTGAVDAMVFLAAGAPEQRARLSAPAAVILAECDNDVPGQGKKYFAAARASGQRAVQVTLKGANHQWFNSEWKDGGFEPLKGPKCQDGAPSRMTAKGQQQWLDSFVPDFLDHALLGRPTAPWISNGRPATSLYGAAVTIETTSS